jgi:hypothetical protein
LKFDTGCQLLIKDKTSKQEILKSLALLLTKLEDEQGIDEYGNIHISFDIFKDEEKQVLVSKVDPTKKYSGFTGQPSAEHKIVSKLPDGSKKIYYDKEVDFKDLEKTIHDAKAKKRENIPQISMSVKEYEKVLRGQPFVKHAVIEPPKPVEKPKTRVQLLQELLSKKLNVEITDLTKYINSVEYLTDEASILDFIDKKQIPVDNKVILIRYRDQETGRVSHNELYTMDLELIK